MVLKSRSVSRVSHVGQLLTSGQGLLGAAMTVEVEGREGSLIMYRAKAEHLRF